MSHCNKTQKILCDFLECGVCYERSFDSYKGRTKNGKLKILCFDKEKNKTSPRMIHKYSNKKFYFNCDFCPHSFEKRLADITKGKWCPYCSEPCNELCSKKDCNFCYERSLASYKGRTKNGKLKIACFDKEKNDLVPRLILKGSSKKFYFNCDICLHSFKGRIHDITKGKWCPFCANQKLCVKEDCNFCFERSFASFKSKTKKGNLKINCFDKERNKIKTRMIAKYCNKKFWFKCDFCKHDFDDTLSHIVHSNRWCPYCSEPCKKLCSKRDCKICFEKSLASFTGKTFKGKYKIECFDFSKNKEIPRMIMKGTHTKYYYICDHCEFNFPARTNHITGSNSWCPRCINKTEKKFMCYFEENYPDISIAHQAKYNWCRNKKYLPYDFSLEELKILIEIDGAHHYRQIANWQSPEKTQEIDNYKNTKANENGYTVIRILQENIWYEKNDWKIKLDECLIKYNEPKILFIN